MCFESNEKNSGKRDLIEMEIKWTIDRLNRRKETNGQFIKSESFNSSDDPKTVWSLYVYPFGVDKKSEDYIGIFLELQKSLKKEVSTKYRISIMNGDRWKPVDTFIEHCFIAGQSFGSKKFIMKSNILRGSPLKKDEFTIRCEIIYENNCPLSPKKLGSNYDLLIANSEDLLDMCDYWLAESQTNGESSEEMLKLFHNLLAKKVYEVRAQVSTAIGFYKNDFVLKLIHKRIVSLINEKFTNNDFQ